MGSHQGATQPEEAWRGPGRSAAVLEDELALTIEDDTQDERRFVTVGLDALGPLLVVVHAQPAPGTIRLISARKATPRERRAYEGGP